MSRGLCAEVGRLAKLLYACRGHRRRKEVPFGRLRAGFSGTPGCRRLRTAGGWEVPGLGLEDLGDGVVEAGEDVEAVEHVGVGEG